MWQKHYFGAINIIEFKFNVQLLYVPIGYKQIIQIS